MSKPGKVGKRAEPAVSSEHWLAGQILQAKLTNTSATAKTLCGLTKAVSST